MSPDWLGSHRLAPAGVSAAITMARAGLSVVVLERGEYPGAKNVQGAVLWRLDKSQAGRSRVRKLIGTELYANASMRSAGTVRTLAALATGGGDPGSTHPRRGAGRG